MSTAPIVRQAPTTTILRSVGGFTFEATFLETHESELEVTENPVETGVVIADHAFMKPLRYTLQAGVSDTPLHVSDADPFGTGFGRSRTAFRLLQQLQATAEPITVVSGLRVYNNLMLTKLTVPQDKDSANALMLTAEFKQIIQVNTQTVTYPPRAAGSTTRQASAPTKKGEQQGQQPTAEKAGSLLSKFSHIFSTMQAGGPPQ